MIKVLTHELVLQEVPDNISVALNLTRCPHRCIHCHSEILRENVGVILTFDELDRILSYYDNDSITCVCFMGGDEDTDTLFRLADHVRIIKGLFTAWYSGTDEFDPNSAAHFNYIKIGGYKEEFGPLNKKTTNQIMYKILEDGSKVDITYKFQEK